MDASLCIRVPSAMRSIESTLQAYELMREVREKHSRNACGAQEAAIALRDVLSLLMIDSYDSFDSALNKVTTSMDAQLQFMAELRSQLCLARATIARLAQCSVAFERAVHNIFRAPASSEEAVDILAAHKDCSQPVRNKRVRKYCKTHDVMGDGSAAADATPRATVRRHSYG